MYYLGVMSGTSCDGVDVVLVDFENGIETIATHFSPYPKELQAQLLHLIANQPISIVEISNIDAHLAEVYAEAIKQLLLNEQLNSDIILATGLHGQTVYHNPGGKYRNTIQMGSAAIVAQQTGITTVANFRQMDVAFGGEGAPLAPALHKELFSQQQAFDSGSCTVILNLGGIANISVIEDESVFGFDTGPANCLMDEWIKENKGLNYDKDGKWAQQGEVIPTLLSSMLTDPYFNQLYPKSTGKEYFNLNWLNQHMDLDDEPTENVQRTLLRLTAESVALGVKQVNKEVKQVIVCGGGAHNQLMMSELSELLSMPIRQSKHYGVDPDYVEAILMAWFAKQNIENTPLDLTKITGTKFPLFYGVKHSPNIS